MIPAVTFWLALTFVLCIYVWYARHNVFILPVLALLSAAAIVIPMGTPRFTAPPPGNYVVLGADIQIDVAIYVLLKKDGQQAIYYKLPYSTTQANELQAAMDESNGGGVSAKVDGEGGVSYDGEPPVSGDDNKTAERPAVTLP